MTDKPRAYLFSVTALACTEITVSASRVNFLTEVKVFVFISAPEEFETGVLCNVSLAELDEQKSYLSSKNKQQIEAAAFKFEGDNS